MEFLISGTFTDNLAPLTGGEQKAVKTTAFNLQMNPARTGLSFHKIDEARGRGFLVGAGVPTSSSSFTRRMAVCCSAPGIITTKPTLGMNGGSWRRIQGRGRVVRGNPRIRPVPANLLHSLLDLCVPGRLDLGCGKFLDAPYQFLGRSNPHHRRPF